MTSNTNELNTHNTSEYIFKYLHPEYTEKEPDDKGLYTKLPKELYITTMDRGKYGSAKHNWSAIMIWKKSDNNAIGSIIVQDNFWATQVTLPRAKARGFP